MPDLDIIDRNAPRGWARAYKFFLGDASTPEVTRAATKALARSLRENGGFPSAHLFRRVLDQRMSGELDGHSAFEAASAIQHRLGHERHAKIGARALGKLLVEIGHGRRLGGDSFEALCDRFVHELVDHLFFGRIRPEIVGTKRYPGRAEVEVRELSVREALEPSLRKIARELAVSPSADELRAPPTFIGPQPTTEEMLDQPIM